MAEIMEPIVHQAKESTTKDNNSGDTVIVQNNDASSPLCENVSAGQRIITDKEFAKDLIQQARKRRSGVNCSGWFIESVNQNHLGNRPGSA